MSPADNAILDFLSGHQIEDFCAPPKVVAVNTDVSASHVRKRVLKLHKADLLRKLNTPQGYYQVTDFGRRYLTGE
jgi:Mn-dependent DtxR family transcriptional regulator